MNFDNASGAPMIAALIVAVAILFLGGVALGLQGSVKFLGFKLKKKQICCLALVVPMVLGMFGTKGKTA